VADFGAIVHRREPDNPVKDGALSGPFFSLQVGTLEKASTEKQKMRNGSWKGSNSGSNPDGSVLFFRRKMKTSCAKAQLRIFFLFIPLSRCAFKPFLSKKVHDTADGQFARNLSPVP